MSPWLQANAFTGPVPMELGSLHDLEECWIEKNQLTGPLPVFLGSLAGTYTRPLSCSNYAHLVGCVGCMRPPQSIRRVDTGRCDKNG